jgi:hypothetical protein
MKEIVFLVEEPSMKVLLDNFLPKVLPDGVTFLTIKHEGKNDLEKSIPRKLKAIRKPNVQFVVLRDQDAADCKEVKEKLQKLCVQGERPDTLVRIVCHELESWFLGNLCAVEQAFGIRGLSDRQNEKKFREPDNLASPSQVLKEIIPNYQKVGGARTISRFMNLDMNTSTSFNNFLRGIQKIVQTEE